MRPLVMGLLPSPLARPGGRGPRQGSRPPPNGARGRTGSVSARPDGGTRDRLAVPRRCGVVCGTSGDLTIGPLAVPPASDHRHGASYHSGVISQMIMQFGSPTYVVHEMTDGTGTRRETRRARLSGQGARSQRSLRPPAHARRRPRCGGHGPGASRCGPLSALSRSARHRSLTDPILIAPEGGPPRPPIDQFATVAAPWTFSRPASLTASHRSSS